MSKIIKLCMAALLFLSFSGCVVNLKGQGYLQSGLDAGSFSDAPLQENDQTASSYAAEEYSDASYSSITDINFFAEEDYPVRALRVVDEMLGNPRHPQQPFQLSLVDLTQDGMPELLFHHQSGEWGGNCQIFEISGNSPQYLGGVGWPIRVMAVYAKETDSSVEWMIEGNSSHGFYNTTSHCVLCYFNGRLDVTACCNEVILDDDWLPYASLFSVMCNGILLEEVSFSCEDYSDEEIQQKMAGSLYNTYVQDDWIADSDSWLFEEELYGDFSLICMKQEPEDLKSRISLLYDAWLQKQE